MTPEQTFRDSLKLVESLHRQIAAELADSEQAVQEATEELRRAEAGRNAKAIKEAKAGLRASRRVELDTVRKVGILARALADISLASQKVDAGKLKAMQGLTEEEFQAQLEAQLRAELEDMPLEELERIMVERKEMRQ